MGVVTEAEQTAWEVWDAEDTRLYHQMLDVEQDMHEAEAEVRGHDEKIAELEAEMAALRVRRSRFALQRYQHETRLEGAKRKYRVHHELEPDQD